MAKSIKALVKPELLVWARTSANVGVEAAAKAAGVGVAVLEVWEAGTDAPSIAKLRKLADKYKRPLSVFYLQKPPTDFQPIADYRRHLPLLLAATDAARCRQAICRAPPSSPHKRRPRSRSGSGVFGYHDDVVANAYLWGSCALLRHL